MTRTGKKEEKYSLDERPVSSAMRAAIIHLAQAIAEEEKQENRRPETGNCGPKKTRSRVKKHGGVLDG